VRGRERAYICSYIWEVLLQVAGGNDQLALDVFFSESRFVRV